MKERMLLAVGTFFGILIGLFSAWHLDGAVGPWWPLSWLAGIMIGGVVGYLCCDIEQVLRSLPAAWRNTLAVMRWRPSKYQRLHLWLSVRNGCLFFVAMVLMLATIIVPLYGIASLADGRSLVAYDSGSALVVATLLGWSFFTSVLMSTVTYGKPMRYYGSQRRALVQLIVYLNPIAVAFMWLPLGLTFICYHFARGCLVAVMWSLANSRMVLVPLVFVWQLYVLIHTETRLICLLDVMVFVASFYFTHSVPLAFLAAACGAVWSLVNYAVIAPKIVRQPQTS